MTTIQFALAVLAGLAASECTDLVSWLAARLMAWAIRHRYRDPDRAAIRTEELQAVLTDRPTKLLKLLTSTGFATVSVTVLASRGAQSLTAAVRRILCVKQKPQRKAFRNPGTVASVVGGALAGAASFVITSGIGADLIGGVILVSIVGISFTISFVLDARFHAARRQGTRGAEDHAGKG
ncbi:hypothetical protein OHR68_12445 [Spirillospora sp. NBC_00431]